MKLTSRLMFRSLLRFIDISACRFIACFLHCFRATTDEHSTSTLAKYKDSQNHISPLFMSRVSSPCLDKEIFDLDSILIDKGLRDEARFLKACGTIPETPIEMRKASQRITTPHQHSASSSHFNSWFSSEYPSSIKASEQTPSSSGVISIRDNGRIVSPGRAILTAGKTKSVRFECDLDHSHSSKSSENSSSRKRETSGRISFTLSSPNPTPLKLSDEMQTPGTIYPANIESAGGKGRRPRIRSQFVHSVSNLMASNTILYKDSHKSLEQPIPHEFHLISEEEDCNENIYDATPFEMRLEKALEVMEVNERDLEQ